VTGRAWTEVRLRTLYRRRNQTGRPDLPLLSVYRELGVVPREGREDNNNKPGEDLAAYRVVQSGDLVLNKMKTWQGSLGISDYQGIVSPAYIVCEPTGRVDGRFMHHLLRSRPLIGEYAARSKGIRPSQWDLPWEEFGDIRVRLPIAEVQRSIADYLDAETARIDALIAKKRRMIDLLAEQFRAFSDGVVMSDLQNLMPLMRRTDPTRPIMYGIVLPGPDVPEGVPIVKGGDVAAKRLTPGALNRTTFEIEAPYARARVAGNDLVFAIRGGIGDVEVVPFDLAGANITQDVARVAPARDVDPRWLRFVLRTPSIQGQVAERVTGATVKGLNIWDLKRIPIPASDRIRQESDLAILVPAELRHLSLATALARQIELLSEHRQGLITAAVNGEIHVPKAAA
jgi:type I restriction enzyme, S subunit